MIARIVLAVALAFAVIAFATEARQAFSQAVDYPKFSKGYAGVRR